MAFYELSDVPLRNHSLISSGSDLKRWSLDLFGRVTSTTATTTRWVAIWDQFLIQKWLKYYYT